MMCRFLVIVFGEEQKVEPAKSPVLVDNSNKKVPPVQSMEEKKRAGGEYNPNKKG